jgi:hypothetical protein
MSSFIVEPKTINRIVTWLDRTAHGDSALSSSVQLLCEVEGIGLETPGDLNALANALLLLNSIATDTRYHNHQVVPVVAYSGETISDIQVLKSLHCLRYQCAEGNVPRMRFYRFLNRLIRTLERHIIDQLPEYKAAEWG